MFAKAGQIATIVAVVAFIFTGAPAAQAQPLHRAAAAAAAAVVVYNQPPSTGGGILLSSLRDPDGSAADRWVWDGFRFAWPQSITEIRWRGAYDPARFGSGGPVFDFVVEIYASTVNGAQPDVTQPPLVHHEVGGNAHEAAADVLGGVQTYDYWCTLPAPFQAAAGVTYWVQIEAYQSGSPDWGLAAGTNGDGRYFRRVPGQGANYQLLAGDAAFTLAAPRYEGPRLYLPLVLGQIAAVSNVTAQGAPLNPEVLGRTLL